MIMLTRSSERIFNLMRYSGKYKCRQTNKLTSLAADLNSYCLNNYYMLSRSSQPHKGQGSPSIDPSLMFPSHLLPYPVHPS